MHKKRNQAESVKSTVNTSPRDVRYLYNEQSEATHVLIPIDAYEQMLLDQMAADAERILENPDTRWVDGDDLRARMAGKRLRDSRQAQGVTQKQLANKLKVSAADLSRLERNADRTMLDLARRVARALKADLGPLLS